MKVVMIPSVSAGIGHISRTAALARALRRLDPTVQVEYLLDEDQLRPFNLDATLKLGFSPRLLPRLTRENRNAVVQACLGDADVIVDDAARYLLPCRRVVPQAAWVSILMHPVGDELFGDWPLLAQMDALIWPYAPLVELPRELEPFEDKLLRTGPFLETDEMSDKQSARLRLMLPLNEPMVLYAQRGFPFGSEFGHAVLSNVYRAVEALRSTTYRSLKLVLLAVRDRGELCGVPGLPEQLPDWVRVEGIVRSNEALLYTRAADILVAEGTSTMHEGAALRTPLVLMPGPLGEALVVAQGLSRHKAADVFAVDLFGHFAAKPAEFDNTFAPLTLVGLTTAFAGILTGCEAQRARTERAFSLVTNGGGGAAAAQLVLDVAARPREAAQ
jgi:hypothetical protein